MNTRVTVRRLCTALVLIGGSGLAASARADQALVVGVNRYPNISGADLGGCVNDANSMADSLRKYGFQVTLLTDDKATKGAITDNLRSIGSRLRSGEKFVLYFAGHGANDSGKLPVILPSDARADSEANDISRDSLFDQVNGLPTSARTVLLDSCFSGAMVRAHRGPGVGTNRKTRFLVRPKLRGPVQKDLGVINDADTPSGPSQASNICYFAAAKDSEYSQEDDIDGTRHGFFTYYLAKRLTGGREPWAPVQSDVTGDVSAATNNTQHPVLSAKFVDKGIFESLDGPAPPHRPDNNHTVWDDFSSDRVDRSKLTLTFMQNGVAQPKTPVMLNERFKLEVTCGTDGYLVLLALDTEGNLQLPQKIAGQDPVVKVTGGYRSVLPSPTQSFFAKRMGMQEVKAILFSSKERAQALVNAFGEGEMSAKRARKERELGVADDAFDFVTSTVSFEVADGDSGRRP